MEELSLRQIADEMYDLAQAREVSGEEWRIALLRLASRLYRANLRASQSRSL